jgi:hypothetical protein
MARYDDGDDHTERWHGDVTRVANNDLVPRLREDLVDHRNELDDEITSLRDEMVEMVETRERIVKAIAALDRA